MVLDAKFVFIFIVERRQELISLVLSRNPLPKIGVFFWLIIFFSLLLDWALLYVNLLVDILGEDDLDSNAADDDAH